tara:strand:- start:52 stop:798 length:747 start_codon:yes stop_codon:yes gene_type:complete
MTILSIFFFITAILYSSVGFGGGSTYLALMIILDVPYYIFPIIALICNIIVVSGNSVNYIRSGNLNLRLLLPYLTGSIPFAFFGASILIEKEFFELLLFFVLLIAGVFLLMESKSFNSENFQIKKVPIFLSVIIGSILGFISGIVGIGGGIFLSPILYLLKSGYPKQIATTASLFILINSLFGIAGQLTKDRTYYEFLDYWPLFVVVLIGGLIGNILNLKFFSNKTLVIITAVLVIFVSVRMGFKLFS